MKKHKFIFLLLILFSFNSLNASEDELKKEITKNLRICSELKIGS